MRRRELLLGLPLAAAVGCGSRDAKSPAQRAVDYLVARQAAGDGGWHSETYGLLRSGQSLTPFVLLALLESRQAVPDAVVDRALGFIAANVDGEGCLGRKDPASFDYPNYATGLALRAVCVARRPGWEKLAERMTAFLKGQQFAEHDGWKPSDAPYGGWGIGGGHRKPPFAGHVDLSMTRHVLEGLAAAGLQPGDPVFQRAAVFVERCQNVPGDGGFFFSTVVLDANKAGETAKGYLSYGTMTADGILAMAAMGRGTGDARVKAALDWLQKNHRPDGAPGFSGETRERWIQGLRFYYASAYAHAMRRIGSAAVDANVLKSLAATQRSDGSWANPEPLVKEDDPLIATPFALHALA